MTGHPLGSPGAKLQTKTTSGNNPPMIKKGAVKPVWPYTRFVRMFAASNGQWAKKIRGQRYHFGPWANPKAALDRYRHEGPAIESGHAAPPSNPSLTTINELVSLFMVAKADQVKGREMSARMYDDYHRVAGLAVKTFGKHRVVSNLTPRDFAFLRTKFAKSEARRGNEITWTRTIFKWGEESQIIDRIPIYGPSFKKPKARDIRKVKNERGKKRLYSPAQVRLIVSKASVLMKALVLLAINTGMGNTDCSELTMADIDLETALIDNVRHKTGFFRTAPLWVETVDAIRDWIKVRPKPVPEAKRFLFLSPTGVQLVRITTKPDPKRPDGLKVLKVDTIAREFSEYMDELEIEDKSFYDLRHTFRTVAETGAFKERTISRIMGHIQEGIGSEYIHDFSIDKLRAVTDHVHDWYLKTPAVSGETSVAVESPPTSVAPSGSL